MQLQCRWKSWRSELQGCDPSHNPPAWLWRQTDNQTALSNLIDYLVLQFDWIYDSACSCECISVGTEVINVTTWTVQRGIGGHLFMLVLTSTLSVGMNWSRQLGNTDWCSLIAWQSRNESCGSKECCWSSCCLGTAGGVGCSVCVLNTVFRNWWLNMLSVCSVSEMFLHRIQLIFQCRALANAESEIWRRTETGCCLVAVFCCTEMG